MPYGFAPVSLSCIISLISWIGVDGRGNKSEIMMIEMRLCIFITKGDRRRVLPKKWERRQRTWIHLQLQQPTVIMSKIKENGEMLFSYHLSRYEELPLSAATALHCLFQMAPFFSSDAWCASFCFSDVWETPWQLLRIFPKWYFSQLFW